MPAYSQPPSAKIAKLKLFLEKTKIDFNQENTDLLPWLKDRNLNIENIAQLVSDENIPEQKILKSVEHNIIEEFNQSKKNKHQLEFQISFEEYNAIFDKLISLLNLPAGQLETESELYLEQQLSDLLGFDVTAESEGHRLNHSTGIIGSEPHLRRYPNDKLENHSDILEAGMSNHRSAFGWFIKHGKLTKEAEDLEKYYISLQLYNNDNWSSEYKELKAWYKFRKILILNPAEKIGVVGVVGNIDHKAQIKKQFGASPEIIREGMLWSPKSHGKVLLMFIDDPKNEIPLGPIYFDTLLSKNENNNYEQ